MRVQNLQQHVQMNKQDRTGRVHVYSPILNAYEQEDRTVFGIKNGESGTGIKLFNIIR